MALIDVPTYADMPAPTDDDLRMAYEVGSRSRSVEEHIVRLVSRGEVKFAIWGPGEEVHGTATALALSKVVPLEKFGMVPHYRSGALCAMWTGLHGYKTFTLDLLRQQFSKDTDAAVIVSCMSPSAVVPSPTTAMVSIPVVPFILKPIA